MRLFRPIMFAAMLGLSVAGFTSSLAEDDTRAPAAEQPATTPTEPSVSKPETEPDTRAQRSGQLWVCCDDGRERWTATPEVCRQRKGQLLPSRFCERPKYVCCKQGRAEWWMPDADSCHADGGVVAHKSYCR